MKLLMSALVALVIAVPVSAQAQEIKVGEGETVIAANVSTGARFSVVSGADASSDRVIYIDPQGNRVPLLRTQMENKGQCLATWALECHEAFGKPQRLCFCATVDDSGLRVVQMSAGVIVW